MATYSFSQNGFSVGHGGGNSEPPKRGTVRGWTRGAARRNERFLQSIDPAGLDSRQGYGVTLTMRDLPATGDDWIALRTRLFDRIKKHPGIELWHFVCEWQARGVIHLHLSIFGPECLADNVQSPASIADYVVQSWLDLAAGYGPERWCQYVVPVFGPVGWLQYVSKHGARGVGHYQRQAEFLPEPWSKTGQLWGKGGPWPEGLSGSVVLDREQAAKARRQARRYELADARRVAVQYERQGKAKKAARAWKRVAFLRRAAARAGRPRAEWEPTDQSAWRARSRRAGCSGWVPAAVSLGILELVGWEGELA